MAIGRIGMSFEDFCAMDPDEFSSVHAAWTEGVEASERSEWERMRTLAAICIQPHVRKRVTPRQLVPLPWDEKRQSKKKTAAVSPEEQRRRFEQLTKKL